MKSWLTLGCLVGMCCLAVAEPKAPCLSYAERQEKVAGLLQAIYDYDVMVVEVYDADGAIQKCTMLTHSQAEEVAQVLVPLKAALQTAEAVEYPRCVLRILTMNGERFSFELNDISLPDGANYTLPLVEYDRLQGVLMELEI